MSDHVRTLLERDDLIEVLRALLAKLRSHDAAARIRIVGGAAIAITVHADRAATCGITGTSQAADLYEEYYSGDSLTARTEQLLHRLLTGPAPTPPAIPVPPLG